ncbi:MAG: chemotaxis protein CheA [Granulosicoccus sp.]
MDDDLEEFRHIFLDECSENVELLERGLMRMDEGESDADILNEVFRAAHSIKGGGATFGYQPMAELTHYMETLLDEMRSGRREVVAPDVDLLLEGLDLVQAILVESRETSESADHDGRMDLQKRLQASVDEGETPEDTGSDPQSAETSTNAETVWDIEFTPKQPFFLRGNNTLLLIREVIRLGECQVSYKPESIPAWSDFDGNTSYLSWQISLTSSSSEEELKEIFEWVDTDCELSIVKREEEPASAVSDETVTPATETPDRPEPKSADVSVLKPEAKKKAAKPTSGQDNKPSGGSESSSIRIATDKIDQLINYVGELVITQSMLSRVCQSNEKIDVIELRERMADLEHHTRDLQESVMQVRMLPISSAFSRLPRLVRDLSKKLGKDINLVLEGETTELDKTVLERMIDPLVHLVRNGLDHGLETPDERVASGKSPTGTLTLNARQESGSVVIEITDDGKGINPEIILRKARENGIVGDEELTNDQINQLIFAPGFSTAEVVSDVSGRGVGMDVVRRNILDLGGRVHVYSEFGSGTRIEINLPLSLAILDGQLVGIGGETYVIPVLSIIETLEVAKTECADVPGKGEIFKFRGAYLDLVRTSSYFRLSNAGTGNLIVVVDTHGKTIGLVIDEVLGQQQVVIKPLDKNYHDIKGISGATIMNDGSVALILDPANFHTATKSAKAA